MTTEALELMLKGLRPVGRRSKNRLAGALGRHRQHRARRDVQQTLSDAAKHQAGKSSLPTGPHHDHARADILRRVGKGVRGPSCRLTSQLVARIDAGLLQFLDLRLDRALDLVFVGLDWIPARQPVANGTAARMAQTGENRCRGLRPVA